MKAKRIRKWYRGLSLRRKAVILYILWGICCTIPIGIVSSSLLGSYMREIEEKTMSQSLFRAASQADVRIGQLNALSDYLFNNDEIAAALNETYTDNYFDMYLAMENAVGPAVTTYLLLNDSLDAVRFYTDSGLPDYKKYIYPLSELERVPWYEDVSGSAALHWIMDEEGEETTLILARMLKRSASRPKHNYLCLFIDEKVLLRPLLGLQEKGFRVSIRTEGEDGALWYPKEEEEDNFEAALSASVSLSNGWQAFYEQSSVSFSRSIRPARFLILLAAAAVIAAMLVGVYFISGVAILPIESLSRRVESRISADSRKPLTTDRDDEIGALTRNFSRLIEEVYESRIRTEEYRLSALYAQMNPHFLYNTLGLINNKAIVNGQEEISHMVLLLSQFYRTSLNRGQELTTVENELKNCRIYIEILQITYENSFEVSWETDETLFPLSMPNFILQPLIENAIEHGLKDSKKERKLIRISLREEEGELVFTVTDNGVGMSRETLEGILLTDRPGVGLKNIDRRLRIWNRSDRGLFVESAEGMGTTVTARISLVTCKST